jgi:hypothetical protein
MTSFQFYPALGIFAGLTLLLAGVAIGRVLSVSFDEALYLTGVLLVILGWLGNRVMLRHYSTLSEDREA